MYRFLEHVRINHDEIKHNNNVRFIIKGGVILSGKSTGPNASKYANRQYSAATESWRA